MLRPPATVSHDCRSFIHMSNTKISMFVFDLQHRNLKCSHTQINTREAVRSITKHFITLKRKKSSRIVWLLHNAAPALLEMLSQGRMQHTNEKTERRTADELPGYYKDSHRHMLYRKYHRPGSVWYYIINNDALLCKATIKSFTVSVYNPFLFTPSNETFSMQSQSHWWPVLCL